MKVETLVVGELENNTYILSCEETKECIIIDPGNEPDRIINYVKDNSFTVKYLIHTHGHFDHIVGTRKVKEGVNGKILLHKDDLPLYQNLEAQLRTYGVIVKKPLEVDCFIDDNDEITFGKDIKAKVIHTPGHSPGCICLYFENDGNPLLFSGDTLFAGSIGRTDLWEGSFDQIIKSITDKIFTLDENTVVYSGHGDVTTVSKEKKFNRFFR